MKNINDNPLHAIFNKVNSRDKKNVTEVMQGVYEVFKGLWKQNIITEPETTRDEINGTVFDKMTAAENIMNQSNLLGYLNQKQLEKKIKLEQLKNAFKDATSVQNEEEIVDEIIGG